MLIIAGTGKLAQELLTELPSITTEKVIAWKDAHVGAADSIVIHAGSGRELDELISYCQHSGSSLIELATGSSLENRIVDFPVVICPNTNILMLKFLSMLATSGPLFKGCQIRISESHQAGKTSVPGTAVSLAHSLGVPVASIHSVRDEKTQQESLHIPPEALTRHAYHRIEIEDHAGSLVLESKVFSPAPYAQGLAQIIKAMRAQTLENRQYPVMEFIDRNWL